MVESKASLVTLMCLFRSFFVVQQIACLMSRLMYQSFVTTTHGEGRDCYFTVLKDLSLFLFAITAAGVVPCGGPKSLPVHRS